MQHSHPLWPPEEFQQVLIGPNPFLLQVVMFYSVPGN
ncbi:hypothetical protein F441_17888 [Phytophthora nicotianae CJ01A1]|uniref:Uncharacterized protein n=3 Tax=Phytophthora nicotianae TaxID=4792 RepID=V9EAX7_PHYNI|nr:hypothetical protein F443_18018 [Phytophthora nicotianae P1569]ETK75938.1 hypothetical protein L915_17537 [Phytophthora nicotianae]ETL29377.1 hypothetical protein L916_17429 [Phytophthora nicotianae]ETM35839.1 hypothetical protein L914_17331 [Phytophthora nicotianae]ETP05525.1 hypothetical protein F441_17888 [Phytophthora nicotianae CJ01A1]